MMKVIKKHGKQVRAYRLGTTSPVLDQMIREGKLILRQDGSFEVMTRESIAGASGHGQIAFTGDYLKFDNEGFPYPNSASFFEKKHKPLGDDIYEQIPEPMNAWSTAESICPEVMFLLDKKGLTMNPDNYDRFFSAPLWGTIESAPADAVIIFYSITRDMDGNIIDADFNFVVQEEFEKLYDILPSGENCSEETF